MSDSKPLDFDHYRVLADPQGNPWVLGKGGMGITYKAVDTVLGREVALKVINATILTSEDGSKRFLREAAATARLHHRNIATIYHQGRTGTEFYYAMEFIEGMTVQQLVKQRGVVPVSVALDITRQVVQALSEAEKHGLVHRDIKPANVMIKFEADGQRVVKLIDFGLAKFVRDEPDTTELTTAGGYLGTAMTSSPEQCRGEELDSRSDIYSLGITLWFMLEGKPPFSDPNPLNIIIAHLQKPMPVERIRHLPQPLQNLLSEMLEKEPAKRPQNTAATLKLIDACIEGTRHGTVDDEAPTQATAIQSIHRPPPRRKKVVAAIGITVTLLAIPGIWFALSSDEKKEPEIAAKTPDVTPAVPTPPAPEPSRADEPVAPVAPLPETAATRAAAAREKLNQMDWTGFFEEHDALRATYGTTKAGESEIRMLNLLFDQLRRKHGDVIADWAERQVPLLEKSAEQGMTAAYLVLGQSSERRDPDRATSYYRLAAEEFARQQNLNGSLEALVRAREVAGSSSDPAVANQLEEILGGFQKGRYSKTEFATAEPWIERLAKRGDVAAMLVLGKSHTEDNPEAARSWYRQAALRYDRDQRWKPALDTYIHLIETFGDNLDTQFARNRLASIGDQLIRGEIPLDDEALQSIEPTLNRAGDLQVATVLEFLGTRNLAAEPAKALQLFTRAAEAGSPQAMAQAGLMWQKGIGTKPDPREAVSWFRKAADKKNMMGSYLLALCLLEGFGGERDAPRAISLLEDAARLRYAPAMDKLADCYRRGLGVEKNYARALELYDEAIALDHADSLGNKGVMFMNGEGVARSEAQAVKLFEEGAGQGNPWCSFLYGAALWHGSGVEKNPVAARNYLQKAADAGVVQARRLLEPAAATATGKPN